MGCQPNKKGCNGELAAPVISSKADTLEQQTHFYFSIGGRQEAGLSAAAETQAGSD
jgi:hypothetical protein